MFQCPRCGATLPPAALVCQFCGTDVSKVPRNSPYPRAQNWQVQIPQTATWKIVVGHILAGLWILNGLIVAAVGAFGSLLGSELAAGGGVQSLSDQAAQGMALSGLGFCFGIVGLVQVLLGLGMILRWSWVPPWVYILCGFTAITDILSLATGRYESTLHASEQFVSLALNLFLIYIVYQTRDEY